MLPWWGWALLWAVLLVGGGLWLLVLSRRVWSSAKALGREVERAGALLSELEARVDDLRDVDPPPTAVTQDPARLRAQYREQRAERAAVRRTRRAERLPPWARVD